MHAAESPEDTACSGRRSQQPAQDAAGVGSQADRPHSSRWRGGSSAPLSSSKLGRRRASVAGRFFGAALGCLALLAVPAAAHDRGFSREENAWLNRQRAVDGTKCCDEHDAHVGLRVTWRMQGGRFQVRIGTEWRDVPPGRIMRHDPADPSPWGSEALLFYSPTGGGPMIWCFSPEPLM
jgi:hypothetical protein